MTIIYALDPRFNNNSDIKYYTFNPLKVFTARQLAAIYFKITGDFGNIAEDFRLWYIRLHNENLFYILQLMPKRYNKAFYDYLDAAKITPRQFIQRNNVNLLKINVNE